MNRVLVVNAGSSSLKHQLREVGDGGPGGGTGPRGRVLDAGQVERIGGSGPGDVPDHAAALELVLAHLRDDVPSASGGSGGSGGLDGLVGVGHRVVHGGTRFTGPTLVDDDVEAGIDALAALAPLHNPPQLAAIRALRAAVPQVPQVAVFDTAFHATIPARAHTYAIPPDVAARHGVRKYGFHGTSHRYVSRRAGEHLGLPPERTDVVVAHIGNGVSVTAVQGGRSIDTSMGLTPLPGAVMGSRSGDLDPAVVFHLVREAGMGLSEVEAMLNAGSGLKALAGDADVRAVTERAAGGDAAATLALEVYAYRLTTIIGSYLAVLPAAAVVFTAGVGEHAPGVRAAVCAPLAHLGLRLDAAANAAATAPTGPVAIDAPGSHPRVLVVPTDEEGEIAAQVLSVVHRP